MKYDFGVRICVGFDKVLEFIVFFGWDEFVCGREVGVFIGK